MRYRHPLALTLCSTLALVAACSEKPSDERTATMNYNIEEAPAADVAADAATETDVPRLENAAPGVAFTYAYSFTLPGEAISKVQQQHAAACARLGLERCRITGMQFTKPRTGEATGRLDLVIAPELAHDFGQDATGLVEKADGSLGNAEVNGSDAGGAIDQSYRQSASLKSEVARIDARLKVAGLAKDTRVELERKLQQLHEELRGEAGGRAEAEKSLATTPMHFDYATKGVLASDNPFAPAAFASLSSAQTALSLVLLIAGYLLPWLGLALLVYLGVRAVRRSRVKPVVETEATA